MRDDSDQHSHKSPVSVFMIETGYDASNAESPIGFIEGFISLA